MHDRRVHVIATTMSGSVRDWSKLDRIVPAFNRHGMNNIVLHRVDSHAEARACAAESVREGAREIISAGGSGTFNSVLEGCCDSGVSLREIRLGFLRKGSADLIGKALGMPDEVDNAAHVFAEAIGGDHTAACDVIEARSLAGDDPPRHFVGYSGAEIFGRIPHFTENRFIKYYKGVLGQIFGDLGPFSVGMGLAVIEKMMKTMRRPGDPWSIIVDGECVSKGRYQALLVLNGYLGPDLAFTSEPLGSGHVHLFAIRDQGCARLLRQIKNAFNGSILNDPVHFGFESFRVRKVLELRPETVDRFPVNVDGATMNCRGAVQFRIVDSVRLYRAPVTASAKHVHSLPTSLVTDSTTV